MIVLSLTNCPPALRGDLTRWLFEVDTNLYVGDQSARTRDKIWERVIQSTKSGRAVMVYPTNNEQGFDFRVWGMTWEPIDYDGLNLMLRPHPGNIPKELYRLQPGDSKAEKRLAAKRYGKQRRIKQELPENYLVIDLETTGLSDESDEIIEIGATKAINRKNMETFHQFVLGTKAIPPHIEALTGISNETIRLNGRALEEVISDFRKFAGELPIVSHNSDFDMRFLCKAYKVCGYPMPANATIDTLRMARKLIKNVSDYKLGTLLKHFRIEQVDSHRALEDCIATFQLFENLRNTMNDEQHDAAEVNGNYDN